MPSPLQYFLLPANFESDGMTSHSFKMAASDVASFETNLFRIAGTLESETSVSGKTQCLLVIAGEKEVSFVE